MSWSGNTWVRVVAVIAGTIIALACGTNVCFLQALLDGTSGLTDGRSMRIRRGLLNSHKGSSCPQQTATSLYVYSIRNENICSEAYKGTFANLGMYLSGIPLGMMIDRWGPRWGVALGAACLGGGYFPIQLGINSFPVGPIAETLTEIEAYVRGEGSFSVPLLCFFSYLTGAGSCSAFLASLKVCALNFPNSRGTATAFPLAAFGLSAFLFSTVCVFAFEDDISKFLLMLAIGTVALVAVPFFLLKISLPNTSYANLPQHDAPGRSDSQLLHRRKSSDSRHSRVSRETRAHSVAIILGSDSKGSEDDPSDRLRALRVSGQDENDNDERSSLLSNSSAIDPGDLPFHKDTNGAKDDGEAKPVDIRGLALLPHVRFWQLFLMLGLMTGIGLMTIKYVLASPSQEHVANISSNIGNDAQALWRHYDDSASPPFIQKRQSFHVCILSFCSFCGRLVSGIGSDVLVKRLNRSRFWCVFVSAVIFCAAQACAIRIENPHHLIFVSGLTGLAYGFLFGVYPSLVAQTFGVHGLSQNWGTMTLAPIIFGNVFNISYGKIFDRHSITKPDGSQECLDGLSCYSAAYWVTLAAGLASVLGTLWTIWHEDRVHDRFEKSRRMRHDRDA